MLEKPSKEELCKYAKPIVYKWIADLAADSPKEHKEEIEQTAYLRILRQYHKIDPERGWKSFVFNHCRGTVFDYLKFGVGFAESKWSIAKSEDKEARHRNKIQHRVSNTDAEGSDVDVEYILSNNSKFSESNFTDVKINWHLVSRMASIDEGIHVMAKRIRGFDIDEISDILGISKSQVSNLLNLFVERLDDPEDNFNPWVMQTIYAFGLSKHFGMKEVDHSIDFGFPIGWKLNPVDLDSDKNMTLDEQLQLSFSFDVG